MAERSTHTKIILIVIVSLVYLVFGGMLQNGFYDICLWILDAAYETEVRMWKVIIAFLAFVLINIVLHATWAKAFYPKADAITVKVYTVDLNKALRKLRKTFHASVIILQAERDPEKAIQAIFTLFFRLACSVFKGDVPRVSVFRPDGDYLVSWFGYEMSELSLLQTKFYIGNDNDNDPDKRRGTAGMVFLEGKHRIVNLVEKNDLWEPNDQSYVDFIPDRPYPPFRSLIVFPILSEISIRPLAVLCLDSMQQDIFASPDSTEFISAFSDFLAIIIDLYKKQLAEIQSQLQAQAGGGTI